MCFTSDSIFLFLLYQYTEMQMIVNPSMVHLIHTVILLSSGYKFCLLWIEKLHERVK